MLVNLLEISLKWQLVWHSGIPCFNCFDWSLCISICIYFRVPSLGVFWSLVSFGNIIWPWSASEINSASSSVCSSYENRSYDRTEFCVANERSQSCSVFRASFTSFSWRWSTHLNSVQHTGVLTMLCFMQIITANSNIHDLTLKIQCLRWQSRRQQWQFRNWNKKKQVTDMQRVSLDDHIRCLVLINGFLFVSCQLSRILLKYTWPGIAI